MQLVTHPSFLAVGKMESVLKSYTDEKEDSTVADLLANVLDDLLGPSGFGSLADDNDIKVTYYEHIKNETVPSESYNKTKVSFGMSPLD